MDERRLAVVIPTIAGRETLLEATMAAYAQQSIPIPWNFLLVRNRPSIGEAWQDGAVKAVVEGFTHVHMGADDVEPLPGALAEGVRLVDAGYLPSPRIINADTSLLQCGSLGSGCLLGDCPTGTVAGTSQFPIMSAEAFQAISPIPPIHYYADDYIGWALRTIGFKVIVSREYAFRHLAGSVGRPTVGKRAVDDRDVCLKVIAERGLLNHPPHDYDEEAREAMAREAMA